MLAAYAPVEDSGPNIGAGILMPVTNPVERLNRQVKRRADVVGIFPNEASIARLIGAVPFERNDEGATQHRSMQVEAFSRIDAAEPDPIPGMSTEAA